MLTQSLSEKCSLPTRSSSEPLHPAAFEEPGAVIGALAFICHDLRQPLTAILANAEFLARPEISNTHREDCYAEILGSVDRMNDLISSILKSSRGCDAPLPASRNIVDTVGRAIRMATVKSAFRLIRVQHHHEGLTVGWFDSSQLERAVTNLVLNACEAVSPQTGQIVVTTTSTRTRLQISVWDNGPGIAPSIQDTVFQPFATCGKAEGSGLGLAIARKLVEDHGGEIYLDGTGDSGTLFTIILPFAIPPSAK